MVKREACNLATNTCINSQCTDDTGCASVSGKPYCVNGVCAACRNTVQIGGPDQGCVNTGNPFCVNNVCVAAECDSGNDGGKPQCLLLGFLNDATHKLVCAASDCGTGVSGKKYCQYQGN